MSQITHRILIKLIKKKHVLGQKWTFQGKKICLIIKNQEIRAQVSNTFSEAPNSGLTVSEKSFVALDENLHYSSFSVTFFNFHTSFFDFGPVFKGNTQSMEKNLLGFQMQNFMLNLLKKRSSLKRIIIPEACWTLKLDGAFCPNLKYLNKFRVKSRALE